MGCFEFLPHRFDVHPVCDIDHDLAAEIAAGQLHRDIKARKLRRNEFGVPR
jgi:hypothetical protein